MTVLAFTTDSVWGNHDFKSFCYQKGRPAGQHIGKTCSMIELSFSCEIKKKKRSLRKTNKQKTSLDSLIQVDFGKCPSSVLSTGTSTLLCSSLKHWATTEIKHIVLIFLWFIQINTLLTFALDFFFLVCQSGMSHSTIPWDICSLLSS